MDEVTVNVDESWAAPVGGDDVLVPDLVVEGAGVRGGGRHRCGRRLRTGFGGLSTLGSALRSADATGDHRLARAAEQDARLLVAWMDSILEQGSSLSPAFQLVVDGAFATLLCVLLAFLAATRSWHFVFLTTVTVALWASVKWCVYTLHFILLHNLTHPLILRFVHEWRLEQARQAKQDEAKSQ